VKVGHGLPGERRDNRGDQDALGDHHRRRRKQQSEGSEGSRSRQEKIDDQPDYDRWKPHGGIQQDDQHPPAWETPQSDGRAEREPDKGGQHDGQDAYFQR
jgi:hypothetical protein